MLCSPVTQTRADEQYMSLVMAFGKTRFSHYNIRHIKWSIHDSSARWKGESMKRGRGEREQRRKREKGYRVPDYENLGQYPPRILFPHSTFRMRWVNGGIEPVNVNSSPGNQIFFGANVVRADFTDGWLVLR